jgi:probable HAF family extracellular repeat protein
MNRSIWSLRLAGHLTLPIKHERIGISLMLVCLFQAMGPPFLEANGTTQHRVEQVQRPSTPGLIEQAYARREIDINRWALYHAYSLLDPSQLPEQYRSTEPEKCGTWILKEIRRNWHVLSGETRSQMVNLGFTPLGTLSRPTGLDSTRGTTHFLVHYSVTAGNPNAVSPYDGNANGTPDYIDTVLSVIEYVWNYELSTMGYTSPPPDSMMGGDSRYDVYILNLKSGVYGYAESEDSIGHNPNSGNPAGANAYSSFLALRNNYNGFPTQGSLALEVTTAHEFYHAIEYGYDLDEETWMEEATATWCEDEVYDAIDDNLNYLPHWFDNPGFPLDASNDPTDTAKYGKNNWYGSWIFFRYISEHVGGRTTVRQVLESTLKYNNSQGDSSFREITDALATQGTTFAQVFRDFTTANLGLTVYPYKYREGASYPTISRITFHRDTTVVDALPRHSSHYYAIPTSMLPDCGKLLTVTFTRFDQGAAEGVQLISFASGQIKQIPFQSKITLTGDAPIDSLFIIVLNFGATGTTGLYTLSATTQLRGSQYTITDLGKTFYSYLTVNNRGQVVGDASDNSGLEYAYEWANGGLQWADYQAYAFDVNNLGQAVGYNVLFSQGSDPILLPGSRSLDSLAAGGGNAFAINDSGYIVGRAFFRGDTTNDLQPFLWKNGSMQKLGLITDANAVGGEADDINNHGQIVGVIYTHQPGNPTAPGPWHTVLWNGGGNPVDLGTTFAAHRISDQGIIVGAKNVNLLYDGGTVVGGHACSGTGSSPIDLGTIDGIVASSEAWDINSRGDIVGTSNTSFFNHAFLYTGGAMRDLNTLIGLGQCWTLVYAMSINDSGWIAGFGYMGSDRTSLHAYLLTPAVSATVVKTKTIPMSFALYQNYPNPFNPSTTIRYSLAHRSQVTMTAFNILGQHVVTLVNETQAAGAHDVRFDGSNLASGVYFYRIQAGDFVQTRRLLLLK